MRESGHGPRLPLEARKRRDIRSQTVREDLYRHLTGESRVDRTPHFPHPAFSELADYAVVKKKLAGQEWQIDAPSECGIPPAEEM